MQNGYSENTLKKSLSKLIAKALSAKMKERTIYIGKFYTLPELAKKLNTKFIASTNLSKACQSSRHSKHSNPNLCAQTRTELKKSSCPQLSTNTMYMYTCEPCNQCYIGETRRQFQKRIMEHMNGRPPSEISKHCHPPQIENFKAIYRSRYAKTAETLIYQTSHQPKTTNNEQSKHF